MFKHTGKFITRFMNSDTEKVFDTLAEARQAAENYVDNTLAVKPFPEEETYFYGPGNGETSVMVRAEVEVVHG